MQPLPLEPEPARQRRVGAVGEVADAGVLQRGHVHPDLVGAAGLELHLEQAGEPVRLEGVVVGDAVLAVVAHRELPVRPRRAPDRRVDGALERVGVALHEGVVGLVDGAVPEGVLEHGVGALALADHHHPGRADVEPLDDALALGGAAGGDAVARRAQVADDGRTGPAHRRVHGDADRLVDHHDRLVVVDDPGCPRPSRRAPRAGPRPRAGSPRAGSRAPAARTSPPRPRRAARGPGRAGRRPWSGRCRTSGPARCRPARRPAPRGRAGPAPRRRRSSRGPGAGPRVVPAQRDAAHRLHHDQGGRDVDADVGDVEDRPVRQLQEVDHVAAQRTRAPGTAGRSGCRRCRPGAAPAPRPSPWCRPAAASTSTTTKADDREQGDQQGQRPARC